MNEIHVDKIEDGLINLVSSLHKQCIDTKLITIEQWNKEIAPYLSALSNIVNGLMPDSPTARTYQLISDDESL